MPIAKKTGSRGASLGFLLLVFVIVAWNIPSKWSRSIPPRYPVTSPKVSAQILDAYAKLPLSFEVNRGQSGPDIQFLSRGHGLALFLGSGEATFLINQKDSRAPHRQVPQNWRKMEVLSSPSYPAPCQTKLQRTNSSLCYLQIPVCSGCRFLVLVPVCGAWVSACCPARPTTSSATIRRTGRPIWKPMPRSNMRTFIRASTFSTTATSSASNMISSSRLAQSKADTTRLRRG